MRREFFLLLYQFMGKDKSIYALTADLGFGGFDLIKKDFPKNFINCGASEQSMLDIACGLAMDNKIPVVYSITPFLIFRAFETIRTYINHENIPVKLSGSGRDDNYIHDGFSHFAFDIKNHMDLFPNIIQYWPKTKREITKNYIKKFIYNSKPSFLSLER